MGVAWVFPGQGSQKRGMGVDLLSDPLAAQRFGAAAALLGRDLAAVCAGTWDGDLGDLNDTRNAQPALFVLESVLVDRLKARGERADLLAGHSLGEMVALYAAGCFDFDTGLRLVCERSNLMAMAGTGAMMALVGFDHEALTAAVAGRDDVVIANDNSASQVVISGAKDALDAVCERIHCRRAIPLAVSGAFHSPFMTEPTNRFAAVLESVTLADAAIPVVSNATATISRDGTTLKANLRQQMACSVRWRETMSLMAAEGIDHVVEIGPGAVLSGLFKRSVAGLTIRQIQTLADLG